MEAMDGLLEGSVFAYVSMYALLKDNWAESMPQADSSPGFGAGAALTFDICDMLWKSLKCIHHLSWMQDDETW
jgi:hypothetical protein